MMMFLLLLLQLVLLECVNEHQEYKVPYRTVLYGTVTYETYGKGTVPYSTVL